VTPLEELQAAHKRLRQIRKTGGSDWHVRPSNVSSVKVMNAESEEIAYVAVRADAQIIVTLHRTIDAQLAILSNAIEDAEMSGVGVGGGTVWHDRDQLPYLALPLARGINGEAS
jgi:hypothetical protein